MVKNAAGGNKSKGFARKNFVKKDHALVVSHDEYEMYAQVTKIFGGPNCQVVTLDGVQMLCHIRGKFRGRGKRDNFIGNGTWLLVGKREWEKDVAKGKLFNCDVIEVYSDADKAKLVNNVTSVDWSLFISNDLKTIGASDNSAADDIQFIDDKTQEYQDLIEAQVAEVKAGKTTIISSDSGAEIDVDDI